MSDKEKKSKVLDACLANNQNLDALIEYSSDSIVSKTILDKPVGTITLFAFDAGQRLSEHQAPYDAVVQIVEGVGTITIDGVDNAVPAGQIIIMPGNVPHSVTANEKFKMLITMIRTKSE